MNNTIYSSSRRRPGSKLFKILDPGLRRDDASCRLALLSALLLLTACAPTAVNKEATSQDTAQVQAFNTHCSACHALPAPKRHRFEEWQLLLGVMEQRMSERGMTALSEQDRDAILAYLKRHGR